MHSIYRTRAEAAEHLASRGLRCSRLTLQKLASVGGGPIYRIFGNRAVYTIADLDDWAEARMSPPRRSTSDAA